MRNFRALFTAGLFLMIWTSAAIACGPSFPWQLLDDRAATLNTMPVDNSFAGLAAQLLPPPKDNLRANEAGRDPAEIDRRAAKIIANEQRKSGGAVSDYNAWQAMQDKALRQALADAFGDAVKDAEARGLSTDQVAVVQKMRDAPSGDDAFAEGQSLPAAVRLYTAGAVDFHRADTAKAAARFRAILKLPQNDGKDRAVWAAYMLGRIYSKDGKLDEAARAFELTRSLAVEGDPDPLGLAVASYGDEARLHFD
ncbi:MAG TPA: hypothetical protein VMT58_03720, partial [Candidatus Binataceae bacterium]|nr:hypothetical protein [Candidatus Binataceae bacterium]